MATWDTPWADFRQMLKCRFSDISFSEDIQPAGRKRCEKVKEETLAQQTAMVGHCLSLVEGKCGI